MAKYEYSILSRRRGENLPNSQELTDFGSEGWKMVGILPGESLVRYYFRRKVKRKRTITVGTAKPRKKMRTYKKKKKKIPKKKR